MIMNLEKEKQKIVIDDTKPEEDKFLKERPEFVTGGW